MVFRFGESGVSSESGLAETGGSCKDEWTSSASAVSPERPTFFRRIFIARQEFRSERVVAQLHESEIHWRFRVAARQKSRTIHRFSRSYSRRSSTEHWTISLSNPSPEITSRNQEATSWFFQESRQLATNETKEFGYTVM